MIHNYGIAGIFRHASVSRTYTRQSVGPDVTLSDSILSVSLVALCVLCIEKYINILIVEYLGVSKVGSLHFTFGLTSFHFAGAHVLLV